MTWDKQTPAWYTPPSLEKRTQDNCFFHEWKPILLLNHTVFNCSKCDKHKEKYEEEQEAERKKRAEVKTTQQEFW